MVRQGKDKRFLLAVERHWEVGRVRDTGARNEMEPHVELILSVTQQPEEPAFAVHHGTNVLHCDTALCEQRNSGIHAYHST